MNEAWQNQLQPAVAKKYFVTAEPKRIEIQWLQRTIDLRTLTLAEADELVQDPRFTYLKVKKMRKGRSSGVKTTTVN